MPPKISDLEKKLRKAGFKRLKGKGSHRKYVHSCGVRVTISGKAGSDARSYQLSEVREALEMVQK